MKKHGQMAQLVAVAALNVKALDQTKIEEEAKRFCIVCAFLADNPGQLSWRGNHKPCLDTKADLERIAQRFFFYRFKTDYPAPPGTKPDEIVSLVMRIVYGYEKAQTDKIKLEHQHSMSAENIVGALLERYIASVMEAHKWVWCAGDFVKAADFLQYNAKTNSWIVLQIKNRSNSENSSSSAIRHGTIIQKWFRTFAQTGATNWGAFRDSEFRNKLSEDGFKSFVETYLQVAQD